MFDETEVEYAVVLVFPGFGAERENGETVVEAALDWLNANKEEPGFRFAHHVSAHLEVVQDADEARERIEADEDVATVILHDLPDDEREAMVRYCAVRKIGVCVTEDVRRSRKRRKGPWKIVFGEKEDARPPRHTLCADTLTDPVDGDEEDIGDRVSEVIAVLALGVMCYHFETKERPPLDDFSAN